MRKVILLIIIICFLATPSTCFAEGNKNILSLEELTVQVMPEYAYHPNDQKKGHAPLLIGYHGSMVNNSDQPQRGQIEIPLPMEEKNFRIGYVADYSIDLKKSYEIEYTINREKGTISWVTSEKIGPQERYKFVIEFYTDGLQVNKDQKSLNYQFKSFADVGLLNVNFTQPAKAKNAEITPKPKEKSHADGENIFSYHYQSVKTGALKNFKFTYIRSETKPTMELENNSDALKGKEKRELNLSRIAVGAFSGVSILSVCALTFIIRNKNKKQ